MREDTGKLSAAPPSSMPDAETAVKLMLGRGDAGTLHLPDLKLCKKTKKLVALPSGKIHTFQIRSSIRLPAARPVVKPPRVARSRSPHRAGRRLSTSTSRSACASAAGSGEAGGSDGPEADPEHPVAAHLGEASQLGLPVGPAPDLEPLVDDEPERSSCASPSPSTTTTERPDRL